MNAELEEWSSFEEFIEVANKNCNWLILRNFEYLPNDFWENDKDVDVLCEDIESFTKIMRLTKRSWGIAAYETVIDNRLVPIDVRFLGDGYYDKLWQYKMLASKVFTVKGVPRMDQENYFYSLIYHSKIQKYEVKEVYKQRLNALANSLDIQKFDMLSGSDSELARILSKFMKDNHYIYTKPIDCNVPKNDSFLSLLEEGVKNSLSFKAPGHVYVSKYMPEWMFQIIPDKLKSGIKKAFGWN